jgi:hypothetical protein
VTSINYIFLVVEIPFAIIVALTASKIADIDTKEIGIAELDGNRNYVAW